MAEQTVETPVLDLLAGMTAESVEATNLDPERLMLVRIAALVAVDAPPASYLMNLEAAGEIGIGEEEVRRLPTAVAPIVGTRASSQPPATSSARSGSRSNWRNSKKRPTRSSPDPRQMQARGTTSSRHCDRREGALPGAALLLLDRPRGALRVESIRLSDSRCMRRPTRRRVVRESTGSLRRPGAVLSSSWRALLRIGAVTTIRPMTHMKKRTVAELPERRRATSMSRASGPGGSDETMGHLEADRHENGTGQERCPAGGSVRQPERDDEP